MSVHSVTDDRKRRLTWLLPSVADLLFLVILLTALRRGQTDLLNDPGTPWHVRVGIEILNSGPPQVDSFSLTRAGEPWISQAWLCDVVLAWLYKHWSWNGLVLGAALVLAWTYRTLFRSLLDRGSNIAWSLALTLLAAGCGSAHWLVRSHLLSVLFILCIVRWCAAYHHTGSRWIWAIPPLTAIWCNVHGGFLGGLIVVGCSLVGQALSTPRDAENRRRSLGFAAVLVLAIAASLLNPYGLSLHAHLRGILFTTNIRDLIDEWRAPDFQAADARPFEVLLLLTLALLATASRRPTWFILVHLLVWFHFALVAMRQVPLAAIVVTIVLAELTTDWWTRVCDQLGLNRWPSRLEDLSRRITEWTMEERGVRSVIWSCALTVLITVLTMLDISVPALGIGAARLPADRFPTAALADLNLEPGTGPLFNDLNWGGFLILLADPPRPVFVDDRFELYGREFLLEYLDALSFGPSWQKLLDQFNFHHVLIRPNVPLARVLRESSDWQLVHSDESAVLFRRRFAERLAAADPGLTGFGSSDHAD